MAFETSRAVRTTYLQSINESTSPKQINLELRQLLLSPKFSDDELRKLEQKNVDVKKSEAASTLKGIYKFEGDSLIYCWAFPGEPRPDDFAIGEGSRRTLIKLVRVEKLEGEIASEFKESKVAYSADLVGRIERVVINADLKKHIPSLKKLSGLKGLHVGGEITDEDVVEVGKLTGLEKLSLYSGSMTDAGLSPLGRLINLQVFEFGGEQITDQSLRHLAGLEDLYKVRLYQVQVSGSGLGSLERVKNLQTLVVQDSEISGGLKGLPQLSELSRLDLTSSTFDHQDLEVFSKIPKLNWLSLSGTNVSDAALESLSGTVSLTWLSLDDLSISHEGFRHLFSNSKLTHLKLSNTQIDDRSLELIAQSFPKLEELRIDGAKEVTDEGLANLGRLKKLKRIVISNEQFSAETLGNLYAARPALRVDKK